jgi:Fungal Zn(2)-Cys(6) binuclear cluster domain
MTHCFLRSNDMMNSTITHDLHHLDMLCIYQEDDYDMMPPASMSQLQIEMPQMLGNVGYNEIPSADVTEEDSFLSYVALLANQAEQQQQQQLNNEIQEWSAMFSPFLHQLSPAVLLNDDDELIGSLFSSSDSQSSHDRAGEHIEPSSPKPPHNAQEIHTRVSYGEDVSTVRRPRRQNHSCDQCRSSKRACDLPLSTNIQKQKPSTACSTCNVRGLECTVAWLGSKKSVQHPRKRPRTISCLPEADKTTNGGVITDREHAADTPLLEILTSIPTLEVDLARQLAARETCSQQFNLYVDVFDMPLSQCLLPGSMPPRYSLGVAALAPLSNSAHLSVYLDKANLSIKSCWEMNPSSWPSATVAPHIFHTVSVLDLLFQRNGEQRNRASMASRDSSLTKTYKWVAMATATQFAAGKDERMNTGKADSWAALPRSRDIASVTWRIAKQMVFGNIAATSSFRLALSLLLFGLISPPSPSEQCGAFEEDATYALYEGIRRLQTLCSQARARLLVNEEAGVPRCLVDMRNAGEKPHPIQELPSDVREYVLELIGAVEWLVTMLCNVTVATSRGRICAFPLEMHNANAGSLHRTRDTVQTPDVGVLSVAQQHEQEIDDSILMRASVEGQAFTTLLRHGTSDSMLLQSVRQLGSLVVLLSKSMVLLTLVAETVQTGKVDYDEIRRRYVAATTLIKFWRSTFGTFDDTATFCCQQLRPEVRRMVAFCSNDGDLAVFQFYDIAQRLEMRLAQEQSTPAKERLCSALQSTSAYRKEQRLLSAVHVSILASTCQGVSSPGFQGESGLKAHVQDIGAHPVSFTVCQVVLWPC